MTCAGSVPGDRCVRAAVYEVTDLRFNGQHLPVLVCSVHLEPRVVNMVTTPAGAVEWPAGWAVVRELRAAPVPVAVAAWTAPGPAPHWYESVVDVTA